MIRLAQLSGSKYLTSYVQLIQLVPKSPHLEDRIRQAKAMGLRNFPRHAFQANTAWLESS